MLLDILRALHDAIGVKKRSGIIKRISSLLSVAASFYLVADASAQTWNVNANGNWSTAGNWTPATSPNSVGATATLGSIITANRTITVDSNRTIGTLTINSSNSYTVSGGSRLQMDVASGSAAINILSSGSPTVSAAVRLSDNTIITHSGSGLFTLSGVVSETGGAKSLTHAGTGTTLLSGSNSFSGGLTINSGTVRFGNNNANGSGTLTLNGGTVEASGGARTLNESVTVGGDFAVGGANNLTLSGSMGLGGSARTVTVSNTGLTTFSGVISGVGGSLVKEGAGTLLLSNNNSFSGGLTLNTGTVQFGNDNAAGSGTLTLNGGTIEASGGARSLNEAVTVGGNFAVGGANNLTLSGNMSLGSSARTVTVTNTGVTTFSGIVSGSGGLTKAGAQTLVLSANNTYTGATTVNAGTLRAGVAGTAFGSNSAVTMANVSSATLDLNSFNTSIGSLAGGGGSGGNVTLGSATLTTGGDNTSTSYGGVISGTGGLTKTGSGSQTLTGSNSYTGVTTINGGVLSVSDLANGGSNSNIGASGSGAANLVINGGTLQYTGSGSNSNRSFTIGTGGATLDASGSGSMNLTQTGALAYSGSGNRTLTLTGTSTAVNNISADIGNGPGGTTSIIKDGSGTWQISGDNTLTGSVTINNGLLQMNSNTINGGVPGAFNVGDGIGAADSAIGRNFQEGQVSNTSTVSVFSDGYWDINAAAYPNKAGNATWKEETVGQINLYGGHISTGATGSLNINAALPGVGISSFSNPQTALIDATGGQVVLGNSTASLTRTISVEDGASTTDLEIRGRIANSVDGTGAGSSGITKTGDGRLSMTGTEANTYTGATTVNGGTLELAKSSGVTSIAGSAITVNSGGTLLLGNNNQINDAANLTLNSGTLSTGDTVGFSETLGTLTLSGTSSIDLGTAVHLLQFANSSALSGVWSGSLTIYGWTGVPNTSGTSGQIYFGNNVTGLTNSQLSQISFNGFAGGAMLLTSGELVPMAVPETGTVVAAFLLVLLVLHREIRQFASVWLRRASTRRTA